MARSQARRARRRPTPASISPRNTAWLLDDGQITRTVAFLDGDPRTPAPPGTFTVDWKLQNYPRV